MKEYDLDESAAWTDFFNSAPLSIKESCSVIAFPVGGIFATITSKIDLMAFNRVVGLGINELIDEKVLDMILNKIKKEKESPSYHNVLKFGFIEAYKRPNFLFVNK